MENYSYTSYPESGDSSPRSREIDFENPPPWEDQQQPSTNYKAKFMCSYGGKIHPRPHDNQLSYIGGETKILAVDRNIKFSALLAKLSPFCDADVCFKYQLPGEDLDALISVTTDDDLEHMMLEYDRLFRASPKPARLRLFIFTNNSASVGTQSFGSSEGRSERERFVDALNSGPIHSSPPPSAVAPPSNVDFLFGLEKGVSPPVVAAKFRDPVIDSAGPEPEVPFTGFEDRMIGSDRIQKHIQDLQRMRIEEEQGMYRRKTDDNIAGNFAGDFYIQKMSDKVASPTLAGNVPVTVPIPAGYWQEKQMAGGVFATSTLGGDQPVYMIPAPGGVYHSPIGRPMTNPAAQGYYAVQRMPPEVYRDQPAYNVGQQAQSAAAQPTLPQQPQPKTAAYPETYGMVRPTGGMGVENAAYAQMAYDSGVGRQVFYTAAGGVVAQPAQLPQYHAMGGAAAFSGDRRPAGTYNPEGGKVVPAKVSQASV